MLRAFTRLLSAASMLALTALPALAQQERGTISGRVIDKANGHAIPFATVTVVGAQRGGLTDSEGQFIVSGVPAGTYEVKVQFLGYRPESRPGVVVTAGKTTTVNVDMQDIVVHEEKAVEVNAERRLVEVKQGATIRTVNANDIRNLPVKTISEVLQQQAGINTEGDQIHVRGGRADETVFVINGVTNRDLVTGQSTAGQLNARSVAEVNVATGAYDVRYGNALSGVVEVTLKEGGDQFDGTLSSGAGSWGGREWALIAGGPDPVFKPLLSRLGLHLPGTLGSILDVSGSLFETRFRYLGPASGGFFDRLLDGTINPPGRDPLKSSYEDSFLGYRFKYPAFFSPAEDNRWSLRYGLNWKPNAANKLGFTFRKSIAIDQGFSRTLFTANGNAGDPAYPWKWSHQIDHAGNIFEDNVQSSLEWRRTLSTTGYTNFQVSRYFFAQRQDVMGKNWQDYVEPNPPDNFFYEDGDDNTWQDRRNSSISLKGLLVQRIHRHEMEVGFEHEFQDVQFANITNPWVFDPSGLGDAHDLWRVHPWVGDFYVRDRLEYEGFTANVGLRADYWFLGREAEQALADTTNHNITPTTRDAFYTDTRSFFGRRYKMHLSPRVIVAHPITENSSFFFNYGEFTQNPSYTFVYSKLSSVSSESFPLLGNPNLNPQVSVNYEVGAKTQFLPGAAINATFFMKDVYDYPTATTFKRAQGTSLVDIFIYLNGHFSRSKGFEVELEKRRSHYWSGRLGYTFEQTRGKSSDPNEQKVVQAGGGNAAETPLAEEFVRWNRPHKVTLNVDLRFDKQTPTGFSWLKQTGYNLYVQGESGRSYTPSQVVDGEVRAVGEPNSGNAPVQVTTDLRVNRYFMIGTRKLDLSMAGTNIFNNFIINRVDPVTGLGRQWGVGSYDPFTVAGVNDFVHLSEVDDPSNFGPGAAWRLSLDYDF
ncbi:MAG TPA: TonB-dependent receptor [Candidatus Saccharimonadaceae bacterium]|jgi:outer membrane receptor protein involved in Fe transport|nr:TonB-dependent receptor [Candidatus Saccharimonadaceae bacterium]